jgi:hypothetical protein
MKRTSTAFRAHLAQRAPNVQTVSRCVRVQRKDGTVVRFTDHDEDIVIAAWAAPNAALNGTYLAASGFKATDISTTSALNVDNLEVSSPQVAPAILEADMTAGLWDYARVTLFLVNWADLTMGPHYLRVGHLGELSTEVGAIRSEIRGLMQAYTQTIAVLTSPTCRNDFGDARCGVDLAGSPGFGVAGTITGVNADGVTLYDTGRTEAGASVGVAIVSITNANPGVVTLADTSLGLQNGQAITLSGILGPALLNAITVALNPSGATFELSVDTSDTAIYPAYTGGGVVTPVGGGRSIFDGGKITFTSGLNNGLSQDVKSYAPGQITLALPMPYQVNAFASDSPTVLDTYSLNQGCGKDFLTNCVAQFNNGVNFNGEPYIGGIDKLLQVGRKQ